MEEVVERLRGIVGSEYVYVDDEKLYPYIRDFNPYTVYRELTEEIKPDFIVVQPGNSDEVEEVVNLAYKMRIPISIYGGGSGVTMSYIPVSGIVLDLRRINFIRWYDEASNVVHVGSGTYLIELEKYLNSMGYTTGHYPQSMHVASIGGLISMGSIGMYSSGYGGIEHHLLGIEGVIPGLGKISVEPKPRRNMPIPLDRLLINSEGLIGVITSAYLKVYRKPDIRLRGGFILESFNDALSKLKKLVDIRIEPHLVRLFDEYESSLYFEIDKPTIIYEIHGYVETEDIARIHEKKLFEILDGEILEEQRVDRWFSERYSYMKYLKRIYEMGGIIDTIEFGCPWSKAISFYNMFRERMLEIPSILYLSAHISHLHRAGVGIYYTIAIDRDRVPEDYVKIWERALDIAIENGCSISHHHGLGRIRYKYIKYEIGDTGVKLLERILNCIDDRHILRRHY